MVPTNTLQHLYRIITEKPCQKKIFITRSFSQGHQWMQRISRELGPVLNVEIQTVESLALNQSRMNLFSRGMEYVPQEETYWLIMSAMMKLSKEPDSYVPSSMVTPGVVQSFHRVVIELREAGVSADHLLNGHFEHPAKGEYLRKLLNAYEQELKTRNFVDLAALTAHAEPYKASQETVFLLDSNIRLSNAAQQLLHTITNGQYQTLEQGRSFAQHDSGFPHEKLEFFQALGPMAEIKEVIRRIGAKREPWDETECILSDYDTYAPVLYALSRQFGVPCTFSQGLPANTTSLGRAVFLYFEWLESNFHVDHIITALRYGMLVPSQDDGCSINDAIHVLETSGIGWGRDRYSLLREKAAEWLVKMFTACFGTLPEEPAQWTLCNVADSLVTFLNFCHAPNSRADAVIMSVVEQLQHTMQRWGTEPVGSTMAVRCIRDRFESCSVEAAGIPEPGKLYVSSIDNGAHSGRSNTYVLGMEENNWSVSIRQDPVLLDDERERIDANLETSAQKSQRKQSERMWRFGNIRGNMTVSFSGISLSEDSEGSPAYEMLQLFRTHSDNPDADFETLIKSIGAPIGWNHTFTELTITEEDYFLKELTTSNHTIRAGLGAVLSVKRTLADGASALDARKETEAGPYDGVLSPNLHLDGFAPKHHSASKLEKYAKCSLQFFFYEVLGVRPKETVTLDRSHWLDALQRGSLLHNIFYTYMSETVHVGSHNRKRLDEICETLLADTLESVPAPSPHIFAKECESIRQDVDVFWKMEHRRASRPALFELELHKEQGIFELELAEDMTLPLKGFVDRIDEVAPHKYKVIDYKTGNPKYYEENAFFAGGTQIQHALYAQAVEQWLRETGTDPHAEVVEAGYAFPTQRGLGEEIMRVQNGRREDTATILQSTVKAMQEGLFPPTDEPKICLFCDFASVCGAHAEWKKGSRFFPVNRDRLAPLLEVTQSV